MADQARSVSGRWALVAGLAVAGSLALAAQASAFVYWANEGSGSIGRANLDGTGADQSFITGAAFPSGLAVDGEHIYWANSDDDGTIGRANLDGTGVNQSFITGASFPAGIAVDGEHIYWANSTGVHENTIGRANLDGTGVDQEFITGANGPFDVAVDGQHIYWANNGSDRIGRADLDGTNVNQSFITAANTPGGVALDGRHVYWTNLFPNSIGRANLDGSGVNQSFIADAPAPGTVLPAGLTVVGGHIYWANDLEAGTIGRANLDGTGVNQSFITGANYAAAVAVDARALTVSTTGQGAVTSSPAGIDCGTGCSHRFAAGTAVTLTATPEFGWIFTGWSGGGCEGTSPTCELTMDSAKAVTATFESGIFLIIHKDGTGSGTVTSSPAGIDCGTSCQGLFRPHTPVTLTATPDPGSVFAVWEGGGCVGSSPTCEITPNTNWDISVTFNATRTLAVDTSGTGTGTVTSSPAGIDCGTSCSHEFEDGSVVELEAAPNPGSTFTGWSGGGCSGTSPTCELTMDAERTVTAVFAGPPTPPSTRIVKARINARKGKAVFRFKATGDANGFQCKLKRGRRSANFRSCASPKAYRNLKPGRYTFRVAAVGAGGRDPAPPKRRFRIR